MQVYVAPNNLVLPGEMMIGYNQHDFRFYGIANFLG